MFSYVYVICGLYSALDLWIIPVIMNSTFHPHQQNNCRQGSGSVLELKRFLSCSIVLWQFSGLSPSSGFNTKTFSRRSLPCPKSHSDPGRALLEE